MDTKQNGNAKQQVAGQAFNVKLKACTKPDGKPQWQTIGRVFIRADGAGEARNADRLGVATEFTGRQRERAAARVAERAFSRRRYASTV